MFSFRMVDTVSRTRCGSGSGSIRLALFAEFEAQALPHYHTRPTNRSSPGQSHAPCCNHGQSNTQLARLLRRWQHGHAHLPNPPSLSFDMPPTQPRVEQMVLKIVLVEGWEQRRRTRNTWYPGTSSSSREVSFTALPLPSWPALGSQITIPRHEMVSGRKR